MTSNKAGYSVCPQCDYLSPRHSPLCPTASFEKNIEEAMLPSQDSLGESYNAFLVSELLKSVWAELASAGQWPPMNSAHEGYGVLLEELDELWTWVKTKQKNRDLDAMRKEAIQVAAMALRFAHDICNEERGRK